MDWLRHSHVLSGRSDRVLARPRIHLISPAGSGLRLLRALGLDTVIELLALVQEAVGADYEVTGDEAVIAAGEDDSRGGRTDDQARAADLQRALGDSGVAAIVALRGGAWLTRVLPLIDFAVMDHRERRVAVFGFSELTTLVNIVGAREQGLGVYSVSPGFFTYGLQRYAELHSHEDASIGQSPREWMLARFPVQFREFFKQCVAQIEGRGDPMVISARGVRGELPQRSEATFVGGNLTLLSTLVGSAYKDCIRPEGHWLVLEDYNDKPERIDRFLAHLTLARYWGECAGVLIGDFHMKDRDLTPVVLEMLEYHIPKYEPLPVLVTPDIGHTWPAIPLPLHTPGTVARVGEDRFIITWPQSALRTV